LGGSGEVVNSLAFYPALLFVPWPLLLPVRTFFKMEGGESEFAKFTLLTFKAFLELSQNLSGNKQQFVSRAIGCPKPHLFYKLAIFWSAEKRCKDTFLHPPSPFPCNLCNCNSDGICTAWLFWVQLLFLHTA